MRRWITVLFVLMLMLGVTQPAAAARKTPSPYPSSITALGDSITTAYDSGGFGNIPANSWATGTNPSVNSMYLRILSLNSSISGKNINLAVSGSKMADLNSQASQLNRKTEYVTILIGANDVCTPSMETMTDVAAFRSQFETAMQTIKAKAPKAKVYVLSIPNIYNLWEILHDDPSARTMWAWFSICQSMLANPESIAEVDIARRNMVSQRNVEFNVQLQEVCGSYSGCTFDGFAVFNTTFTANDVSTIDYFHPSLDGQAKVAEVAWNASGLVKP